MKKIDALPPCDNVLWMNCETLALLKGCFPASIEKMDGLDIFVDNTLPYRKIESGNWVRASTFEEGATGRLKSVTRHYQI